MKSSVDLVFGVGHPDYYPQRGFTPVSKLGFEAFCSIPEKDANTWMAKELRPNIIGAVSRKVIYSDALNKHLKK